MNTFTAPEIDYVAISPILIVGIAALLSVLAETFVQLPSVGRLRLTAPVWS